MRSKDYKRRALAALKGHWIIAVIAGFIALMLGGVEGFSMSYSININVPTEQNNLQNGVEQAAKLINTTNEDIVTALIIAYAISLAISVALFIVGSAIMVGYAKFNLDLIDGNKPRIRTLFSRFGQIFTMIWARILVFLHVFVGLIFFIVPGIIALYQYVMVPFVLADNPGLTAREALRESKRIMKGNKWRYFCLTLGFVGWSILATFTGGVGYYVLIPYMQAAYAGFYRSIKTRADFYY